MDKGGCIITYPVDGHKETALKSAIRLGINKLILMAENESYKKLFNKFGLITDVRPILTDDVSLVVSSVADIISRTKEDHDDVGVLLLPSSPIVTTGMYIAACMEKVKVLTLASDLEMKYLTLPLFPFVNLNNNEIFILTKIIENKEITTKNLFTLIKKEGNRNMLFLEYSEPVAKEKSALRQVQRILHKLEKIGVINKEKRGRFFIWSSTSFGKLVFDHKKCFN